MEDKIKTIFPITCPHCKKVFFSELIYTNPQHGSVFTEEEVAESKKLAKEKISFLNIPDGIKVKYIDWIDDVNTIFGKEEIELIIKTAEEDGK